MRARGSSFEGDADGHATRRSADDGVSACSGPTRRTDGGGSDDDADSLHSDAPNVQQQQQEQRAFPSRRALPLLSFEPPSLAAASAHHSPILPHSAGALPHESPGYVPSLPQVSEECAGHDMWRSSTAHSSDSRSSMSPRGVSDTSHAAVILPPLRQPSVEVEPVSHPASPVSDGVTVAGVEEGVAQSHAGGDGVVRGDGGGGNISATPLTPPPLVHRLRRLLDGSYAIGPLLAPCVPPSTAVPLRYALTLLRSPIDRALATPTRDLLRRHPGDVLVCVNHWGWVAPEQQPPSQPFSSTCFGACSMWVGPTVSRVLAADPLSPTPRLTRAGSARAHSGSVLRPPSGDDDDASSCGDAAGIGDMAPSEAWAPIAAIVARELHGWARLFSPTPKLQDAVLCAVREAGAGALFGAVLPTGCEEGAPPPDPRFLITPTLHRRIEWPLTEVILAGGPSSSTPVMMFAGEEEGGEEGKGVVIQQQPPLSLPLGLSLLSPGRRLCAVPIVEQAAFLERLDSAAWARGDVSSLHAPSDTDEGKAAEGDDNASADGASTGEQLQRNARPATSPVCHPPRGVLPMLPFSMSSYRSGGDDNLGTGSTSVTIETTSASPVSAQGDNASTGDAVAGGGSASPFALSTPGSVGNRFSGRAIATGRCTSTESVAADVNTSRCRSTRTVGGRAAAPARGAEGDALLLWQQHAAQTAAVAAVATSAAAPFRPTVRGVGISLSERSLGGAARLRVDHTPNEPPSPTQPPEVSALLPAAVVATTRRRGVGRGAVEGGDAPRLSLSHARGGGLMGGGTSVGLQRAAATTLLLPPRTRGGGSTPGASTPGQASHATSAGTSGAATPFSSYSVPSAVCGGGNARGSSSSSSSRASVCDARTARARGGGGADAAALTRGLLQLSLQQLKGAWPRDGGEEGGAA